MGVRSAPGLFVSLRETGAVPARIGSRRRPRAAPPERSTGVCEPGPILARAPEGGVWLASAVHRSLRRPEHRWRPTRDDPALSGPGRVRAFSTYLSPT